jgi:hypothetical protein
MLLSNTCGALAHGTLPLSLLSYASLFLVIMSASNFYSQTRTFKNDFTQLKFCLLKGFRKVLPYGSYHTAISGHAVCFCSLVFMIFLVKVLCTYLISLEYVCRFGNAGSVQHIKRTARLLCKVAVPFYIFGSLPVPVTI